MLESPNSNRFQNEFMVPSSFVRGDLSTRRPRGPRSSGRRPPSLLVMGVPPRPARCAAPARSTSSSCGGEELPRRLAPAGHHPVRRLDVAEVAVHRRHQPRAARRTPPGPRLRRPSPPRAAPGTSRCRCRAAPPRPAAAPRGRGRRCPPAWPAARAPEREPHRARASPPPPRRGAGPAPARRKRNRRPRAPSRNATIASTARFPSGGRAAVALPPLPWRTSVTPCPAASWVGGQPSGPVGVEGRAAGAPPAWGGRRRPPAARPGPSAPRSTSRVSRASTSGNSSRETVWPAPSDSPAERLHRLEPARRGGERLRRPRPPPAPAPTGRKWPVPATCTTGFVAYAPSEEWAWVASHPQRRQPEPGRAPPHRRHQRIVDQEQVQGHQRPPAPAPEASTRARAGSGTAARSTSGRTVP